MFYLDRSRNFQRSRETHCRCGLCAAAGANSSLKAVRSGWSGRGRNRSNAATCSRGKGSTANQLAYAALDRANLISSTPLRPDTRSCFSVAFGTSSSPTMVPTHRAGLARLTCGGRRDRAVVRLGWADTVRPVRRDDLHGRRRFRPSTRRRAFARLTGSRRNRRSDSIDGDRRT